MLGTHLTAREYFDACQKLLRRIDLALIEQLADEIHAASEEGRRVFLCCDGPAAAGVLPGNSTERTVIRESIVNLTDRVSAKRAGTNGEFVEQLESQGGEGDVLIAVSRAGDDASVLEALRWANRHGLKSWALTSHFGRELGRLAGHVLRVPLADAGIVDAVHLLVLHWVFDDIAARIAGTGRYESAAGAGVG